MSTATTSQGLYISGLKPDISFRRDDAYRFMPRIIALVVAVVAFMLLLAMSLGNSLQQSSLSYRDTILMHVPAQDDRDHQALLAGKLVEAMRQTPQVSKVTIVSNAELQDQLKPWIGQIDHVEALPIPVLVKVKLSEPYSDEVLAVLSNMAGEVDDSIIVDTPTSWSENYSRFSTMVQWVLFGFAIALLLGVAGLLSFVATTAIKLHRRTVRLLHSIGATDNYIAAQFQINSAWLAIRGALFGTAIAAAIYVAIGFYLASLGAALLPDLSFGWRHMLIVIALPILAGVVGFTAGRFASLRYLRRLM